MVNTEVIFRTFQVSWCDSAGTAFAIDYCNKQYLVTARHVMNGINDEDSIKIFHDGQWKILKVKLVGVGEHDIDAIVLACPELFMPHLTLEASANKIGFGQQVYFTGFPFGSRWEMKPFSTNSFPAPFVKSGILSGATSNNTHFFVDGHNNRGFSGGPVVFKPVDNSSALFRVAGVVSGYQASLEPIVDKCGNVIRDKIGNPIGYVQENSGLITAVNIGEVTKIIDSNPIGCPLHDPEQKR